MSTTLGRCCEGGLLNRVFLDDFFGFADIFPVWEIPLVRESSALSRFYRVDGAGVITVQHDAGVVAFFREG